jgi:hypothetical protein
MRADDPNLPSLRLVAEAIGELREEVVFVGGAVAGLLVSDPLADAVRATRDIDAIVDAGYAKYQALESAVAARGFERDIDSGVICRWIHRASGTVFDLMPVQPDVLGFSNAWYPYAVASAQTRDLGGGQTVSVVSAVAFIATKFEAFRSRGRGDLLTSHDLEDILQLVDGRSTLPEELDGVPIEVQNAVREGFAELLAHPDFANLLPGLISDGSRAPLVVGRLRAMAQRSS